MQHSKCLIYNLKKIKINCKSLFLFLFVGDHLVLDKELFVQVKPGLSSYADNPEKVNKFSNFPFINVYRLANR